MIPLSNLILSHKLCHEIMDSPAESWVKVGPPTRSCRQPTNTTAVISSYSIRTTTYFRVHSPLTFWLNCSKLF